MWNTRNEAIHKREEKLLIPRDTLNSTPRSQQYLTRYPTYASFPPARQPFLSEAAFFKRGAERIKQYKIRRKELWVEEAMRIKEAFFDSLDATSDNFLDFFENATTR